MAVGMSVWMWMYACACPPMCRERESKCSKTLTIVKSRQRVYRRSLNYSYFCLFKHFHNNKSQKQNKILKVTLLPEILLLTCWFKSFQPFFFTCTDDFSLKRKQKTTQDRSVCILHKSVSSLRARILVCSWLFPQYLEDSYLLINTCSMNITVECPGMGHSTRNTTATGGRRRNVVVTKRAPSQDERLRRARDKEIAEGETSLWRQDHATSCSDGETGGGERGIPQSAGSTGDEKPSPSPRASKSLV